MEKLTKFLMLMAEQHIEESHIRVILTNRHQSPARVVRSTTHMESGR